MNAQAYIPNTDLVHQAVIDAKQYLATKKTRSIKSLVKKLYPADTAEMLQQLPPNERKEIFVALKGHINPEAITYLDNQICTELFQSLSNQELAAWIDHLESDDALEIISNLDEARQFTLLSMIPKSDRDLYEESLSAPEGTAGRIMRREVVTIPKFATVGKIIDHLRDSKTKTPEHFHNIIVVGQNHKPVGMISLATLSRSSRSKAIGKIMQTDIQPIPVNTPQEEVAKSFQKYGYVEMPVVDDEGRLLGTITLDDIVFVIKDEHKDDLLKLGGISTDDFYSDIMVTLRSRFSWLAVNLVTAILASVVIALFEGAIEKIVALAILMPIVASMGGNAGTQALTVAVRALATGELTTNNSLRIISKEMLVGGLNGILFAIIGGLLSWAWFDNPLIGIVIGLALIANLLVAGLAGASVPLMLQKWGADPAIASSVVLTTVTDVVGFLVFLGLGVIILL